MPHIRKGDTVKILIGKDRGKTGKVIAVSQKNGRATVEGLNLYYRHERPKRAGTKGQKIQFPRPVELSNLMVLCPHCKKPSRHGNLVGEEGLKTRACKRCGKRI